MKLNQKAEIYIPSAGKHAEKKLLAIVAHEDDAEAMALDGILRSLDCPELCFSACVVTDGAGSAHTGPYAGVTPGELVRIRAREQKQAAEMGQYHALFLLNFTSSQVKRRNEAVVSDLVAIIGELRPEVVYTHNLCDRHATHLGVSMRTVEAIRRLPKDLRPKQLLGAEAWRGLDWLCPADKLVFDVSARRNLANALIGIFDSQITGGKRYDFAVPARQCVNATYHDSHSEDGAEAIIYGMDMTPLIADDRADPTEFAAGFVRRLEEDVRRAVRAAQED